jgi:hypothetical protein
MAAKHVRANKLTALALLGMSLGLLAGPALSQQATQEQQNAIRSNCRSDFMSNCSGVPRGGAEALQCLQRNLAKLSPGCKSAVSAIAPRSAPASPAAVAPAAPAPTPTPAAPVQAGPAQAPAAPVAPSTAVPASPPSGVAAPARTTSQPARPAPAAAPAAAPRQPTSQQQAAIRKSCQSDFMSRCAGVQPGGTEALQCLQRNAAQVSQNCRKALSALSAPARTTSQPARPAPTAAPAAAPRQPTSQQQAAIRQSCQSDFMSRCAGVQPGGADALRCLQRNAAQLSPNCQRAVAALGGGVPPATPAPAIAVAPAVQPTPDQLSAIRLTCRRDFMANCRGVPQGGPEALACLQRNAARLSPDCRTSLAAIEDAPAADGAATPVAAPAARPAGPPGPFPLGRAIRERLRNQ